MEENGRINTDQLRAYTGNVTKLASVIDSLIKSEGWQVFLALFEKEKKEIKEKEDYSTLEQFNADRKAIKIFENILDRMNGYSTDAKEAGELLTKITTEAEGQTPNKGSLMIDVIEEQGREF